jgi:hypothetical protein
LRFARCHAELSLRVPASPRETVLPTDHNTLIEISIAVTECVSAPMP